MHKIRVAEIADGIYQHLVTGDEPLLFHTGLRSLHGPIAEAAARVVPVPELPWITFGHVEADEGGSLNEWLAAAPDAIAATGVTRCMVSVTDIADRPPRSLADEEVLDIGGHRMRWTDTPHLPHGGEAGLLYDQTAKTLLCGDLLSQWGPYPPTTSDDIAVPGI